MALFDLNDVFQPSAALRGSRRELFVGRSAEFVSSLAALAADGGALCILGERGIGKTSFAWRLVEYIKGDTSWASQNVAVPIAIPEFDVVWLEVQQSHQNVVGIILDLLSNRGRSSRWGQLTIANELAQYLHEHKTDPISQLIESAVLGELQDSLEDEEELEEKSFSPSEDLANLDEKQRAEVLTFFSEAITEISAKRSRQIVFFLDEIDRLPDKSGLGQLIKSGSYGKFCIIGVGDRTDELIIEKVTKDHPSAERKVTSIPLNRLSKNDVSKFIERANRQISHIRREFSLTFEEHLFKFSEGFPYIIHRLGRDALLLSLQDTTVKISPNVQKSKIIDKKEFWVALDGFLNPNVDGGFRYTKLNEGVDSTGKEDILFTLAEYTCGWVDLTDLKDNLGKTYGFATSVAELKAEGLIAVGQGPSGADQIRFFDPKLRAIVLRVNSRNKKLYHKKNKR